MATTPQPDLGETEVSPLPPTRRKSPDDGNHGRCALLELPEELQVMIFKMAFITSDGVLRTVSLAGWIEAALHGGDITRIPQPFPNLQVEKFLVSKEFFYTAARTYVQHQRIDISASRLNSGRTLADQPKSILCRLGTNFYVRNDWLWQLEILAYLPFRSVRWLEVELNQDDFGPSECRDEGSPYPEAWVFKDVLKVVLGDESISFTDASYLLGHFRGLAGIKLHAVPMDSSGNSTLLTPAELKVWQTNLLRLEELLKDRVTKRRRKSDEHPCWIDFECREESKFLVFERFQAETREQWGSRTSRAP
jgi:hypothetical protein